MYDASDIRSTLKTGSENAVKAPTLDYADVGLIEFHKGPPQESGPGFKTWYGRGQNFVLSYTEAEPGTVLARDDQPDEYMAFFPEQHTVVDIETANGSAADVSYQLAIIPPGASRITVKEGGQVIRLFSSVAPDLCALCSNADSYREPHPNVPPFQPWPNPPEGFKLRLYPMDPGSEPGRFGNLYRSTNLMINLFPVVDVERDQDKLSPHSHDDFEQCSLTLVGRYRHYLRWPWTPNRTIWRDDRIIDCESPSITVIPSRVIHTSIPLPKPPCHLIDIFSPPRVDFSEKEGWVRNADEYPMP
jgi:hypothetical protein